jgi:hypothetical protein
VNTEIKRLILYMTRNFLISLVTISCLSVVIASVVPVKRNRGPWSSILIDE